MGGPGFDFFKTRGGLSGFPPVEEFSDKQMKRMIYAHKIRMEPVPIFGAFDCPDAGLPTPRRSQSTTAIQALNLFNSEFVIAQAEFFAKHVAEVVKTFESAADKGPKLLTSSATNSDPTSSATLAFRLALGRLPNRREHEAGAEMVETHGLAHALSCSLQQQRISVPAMNIPLSHSGRELLRRRDLLGQSVSGLAGIALSSLLNQDQLLANNRISFDPQQPHAARKGHFDAKAKNVLVIFCAGACSQLETYDYKPELIKRDGQPLEGGPAVTFQGPSGNLARPQYDFSPAGRMWQDGVGYDPASRWSR